MFESGKLFIFFCKYSLKDWSNIIRNFSKLNDSTFYMLPIILTRKGEGARGGALSRNMTAFCFTIQQLRHPVIILIVSKHERDCHLRWNCQDGIRQNGTIIEIDEK
jgi:hypothetical protein